MDNCDCNSYGQALSRRNAMRGAVAGMAGLAVFGSAFVQTAYATGRADRMLVILSMRGAADGLSLVVPHGDPVYYQARPSIAVPKASLLRGDSFFGLHPSLNPLLPLWDSGKMAAIHATGQPVTTRSHFAAMEEVEDADPGSSERIGWLNRLMSLRAEGVSELTGLQLGTPVLATQLAGPAPALTAASLEQLQLAGPGNEWAAPWEAALGQLWANAPGLVGSEGRKTLGVAKAFQAVPPTPATVIYPDNDLGQALASTARVLKADVGAEIVTVDHGSWDHHQYIGSISNGNLKSMADVFAASVAAFFQDLGAMADRVTLVTISEFGRRVKENANQGLDHGHGNVMFVMGAGVRGGYYGSWPGIANTVDADLPITNDYRSVLAEVVGKVYPDRSISTVFPNFVPASIGFMLGTMPPVPPQNPDPQNPTPQDPGTQNPQNPGTQNPPSSTPTQPPSWYKKWEAKRGQARVGKTIVAGLPVLTRAGKRAGVTITYRWETVSKGKVVKRGKNSKLRLRRSWLGSKVRVRVICSAPGYQNVEKTFNWPSITK